jgi:UDP-glucuronate 4-epimerase
MAHAYGHLYSFKTTGLRFFTVYGPWGRPDMAYYSFVQSIFKGKAIEVFNNGKMERDFTYIDDIVDGVVRVIEKNIDNRTHYKIYNIGNNKTVKLLEFISTIEIALGKKAIKLMRPNQPGDVPKTWADISALKEDYGYNPDTNLSLGIPKFIDWYKKFIKII